MAFRKDMKKKAAPRRVARKPVRRVARRTTNVGEYASLSETRTLTVQGGLIYNTLYALMNTQLSDFVRAPIVAQAYQHYRIKHVKLSIKPPFDTFDSTATTGYGKPYLYHMIDKSGAIPNTITLEGLKGMGAKPRALDEKPLTISWAPSVLTDVMTVGGAVPASQGSQYKISPWLSTSANTTNNLWAPSEVDHLGVYWFVYSPGFSGSSPVYTVDIEVQFEFKKPLLAKSVGDIAATPVRMAVLDRSPDGIEGGSDGITIPMV